MKTLLNPIQDRDAGTDYLIYNLFKNHPRHTKTHIKAVGKSKSGAVRFSISNSKPFT